MKWPWQRVKKPEGVEQAPEVPLGRGLRISAGGPAPLSGKSLPSLPAGDPYGLDENWTEFVDRPSDVTHYEIIDEKDD